MVVSEKGTDLIVETNHQPTTIIEMDGGGLTSPVPHAEDFFPESPESKVDEIPGVPDLNAMRAGAAATSAINTKILPVTADHLTVIAEDLTLLKKLLVEAWAQEKVSALYPENEGS